MEVAKFTAAEKSTSSSQQCHVHVEQLFIYIYIYIQGIVHKEFVPPGQTANGKFYCEVLKQRREGIRRKLPDTWKNNNWFLHHDNAPAHTPLVAGQFLTSKTITVIPQPHPLYSSDLAPLRVFPVPQDEIAAERASF